MDTTPLFRNCLSCGKLLLQQPGALQIPACPECLGSSHNPTLTEAWRTHLVELQENEKRKKSWQNRFPKTAVTILAALCFVGVASYITNSYLQKRQADILISISEPDVVSVTEIPRPNSPTPKNR